jgi:methyl-accepting chemotaxis protein
MQVDAGSQKVASDSQILFESASQLTKSLETTVAALDEMASVTRQNAGNAGQADQLMRDVNQVVESTNGQMNALTQSMAEISSASNETSKIIKTIDEIAFQTNLLALNASVEAARAGEAGAGFAVVASEVRNLALRAAQAAKNTGELIAGIAKKIADGEVLVSSAHDAFADVARRATKAGTLVSEIATASKEQAEGIHQVNTVVGDIEAVTQQLSANVQSSSTTAEQMQDESRRLIAIMTELAKMMGTEKK